MGRFLDEQRLAQVSAGMDLRPPNETALRTIAHRADEHFAADASLPLEGVLDLATAVGKTFILAAAIDYFAALGFRNFAVITPGRTITRKTVANFTPGNAKTLLDRMETRPVVITSESFSSPGVRAVMEDPQEVKLYIFTVQSFLRPTTKAGRRTHEYDEDLGAAFYAAVSELDDLIVFPDEYHVYSGPKFSEAVRGLTPMMLFGLTATPPKGAPVLYRYPLAAAIADGFVKTPVLVARKDDRTDPRTKLADGVRLLETKRVVVERYRDTRPELPPLNPVMLVVAQSIADAEEYASIVRSDDFEGGRYRDAVLVVHSDAPDVALEALDTVEDPTSPVRIILSVGMLKEGWDVKNVYVIASMRASVSEILTEQTLGRGLRLPFGERTGIELLDTLEVLAHERYTALLKQIDKIRETFIDYRTELPVGGNVGEAQVRAGVEVADGEVPGEPGGLYLSGVEERLAQGEQEATLPELRPRTDFPTIDLPAMAASTADARFSLNDITDLEAFERVGRRIASDTDDTLRRMAIEGEHTAEGEVRLVRKQATAEAIHSPGEMLTVDVARTRLRGYLFDAENIPPRPSERAAMDRILDAFVRGIGEHPEAALSAYLQRGADRILARIREAQRGWQPKVTFAEEVNLVPFNTVRMGRPNPDSDRHGPFRRGAPYSGWRKSLYEQDWFDSKSAERDFANLIDESPEVVAWLRLQVGDLRLPWRGPRENYHPDFVVLEMDGTRWVVEGKRDSDAERQDVLDKADAARRWAQHVSAKTGENWRYLFALETDIADAKTWSALKQLAG